jgi:acetyl esterase/lipase
MESAMIDRRSILALAAAMPVAAAAAPPALDPARTYSDDPTEVVPLWPGLPPGAPAILPDERYIERDPDSRPHDRYVTNIARPSITVFRAAKPNGDAMLVVPGGGYSLVVTDKEGYETARWLNARGVTAFVLRYRLPGGGWAHRSDVPLQDAQRAMRLIRARAADFAIDPRRVAVTGFSAGGHVAASLAVRHAADVYAPVDAADRLTARPQAAALIYPVISMGAHAHLGSRDQLIGKTPDDAAIAAHSPDRNVTAATPPTILIHAADDDVVPLENSLGMFDALRSARIPAELHVFEKGGHGFGLRLPPDNSATRWPDLVLAFARSHGFA